ncbi:MAG TPA: PEPxxWA-CTERM sorting domain-containing protein, partial [Phenylobacterium sp.]|nr:PEPxxWA-CTERM sorting domain-containing protein [Phenylobacterium sp.]
MSVGIRAAAVAVAIASVWATSASATIFFGNYTPSDTTATTVGSGLPLTRRTPDASQTFTTSASHSSYCANFFCTYVAGDYVMTSFTVDSTFDATNLIVPMYVISQGNNRRTGFNIERLDGAGWTGLGFMQVESGLVPGGIFEVDVPFGNSSGSTFGGVPIHFDAGATYRIRTNFAAGGIGYLFWYLSDEAAASGQSTQLHTHAGPEALAYQPAFALTDGGALVYATPGGIPEPATWALAITGFGLVGASLRRR